MTTEQRAYLTVGEAAEALGLSPRQTLARARRGALPALQVRPGLWRVEAQAVDQSAPPPIPEDGPDPVTVDDLAELWRVNHFTLYRAARAGELPLRRKPMARRLTMSRREFCRWVVDHTAELEDEL